MNDLKARLKNRADLEKLEQDLSVIERLVDEGAVGEKIIKLARQARLDLEAARAAHIELVSRLKSPLSAERSAARRQIEQQAAAGLVVIFDPQAQGWRPVDQLLDEARAFDERLQRQEAEYRQAEAELAGAVRNPPNLHRLQQLIQRVEEMLALDALSPDGKENLIKAREGYESGCRRHRELTLDIHNGTLKERFAALGKLRDWITAGETWILDAPEDLWRTAEQILAAAEQSCVSESARLSEEVLTLVGQLAQTDLRAALQDLYLALDLSIPYVNADRNRLKVKYNELYQTYQRQKGEGQPQQGEPDRVDEVDMAGFIAVRALHLERLKKQFNQAKNWLNQFFHSAVTRPVASLLADAEAENTPPARTVELIEMGVGIAIDALEGSLEIPETMIRGAVILFNKGITHRARDLLRNAMPLYTLERPDKIHRHAVTAWMLGSINVALGNRYEGYSNWKTARKLFEELQILAAKEKQVEKSNWYRDRLKEMTGYSIQTFEEIYFQWMNQFEAIELPQSLKEYREILDRQLSADEIIPLRETLRLYLESSQNFPIKEIFWNALVDVAFYEYETRQYASALVHLNQARIGFQASHRGAVVLWLSGIIQWWLPSKRNSALQNWESSIRIFHQLSRTADQQNEMHKHTWYDLQIELMSASLREWVQLTKPG